MNSAPAKGELQTSGFKVEKLYAIEQAHSLVDAETGEYPEQRPLTVAWDWRILEDGEFEVQVGLTLDASRSIPERLSATLVGRFNGRDSTALTPTEFARLNAIAFLLPYAREAITSLSARGPFGPVILPPLSVPQLIDDFSDEATTAARQLKADPTLLEKLQPGGAEAGA